MGMMAIAAVNAASSGINSGYDMANPTQYDLNRKILDPAVAARLQQLYGQWTKAQAAGQTGLADFISKYMANQGQAARNTAQEQAAIEQFYNGGMAGQLAQLRAGRTAAIMNAARVASQQALRGVSGAQMGEQGAGGSYAGRMALGALLPIQTQAALDSQNQERSDIGYLTGQQLGLQGQRTALGTAQAGYPYAPAQWRSQQLASDTGALGQLGQISNANTMYYLTRKAPPWYRSMGQGVQTATGTFMGSGQTPTQNTGGGSQPMGYTPQSQNWYSQPTRTANNWNPDTNSMANWGSPTLGYQGNSWTTNTNYVPGGDWGSANSGMWSNIGSSAMGSGSGSAGQNYGLGMGVSQAGAGMGSGGLGIGY